MILMARATSVVLFSIVAWSLPAQTSLTGVTNDRMLRLELDKPLFEEGDDVGFLTLATFINGQFPLSDQLALVAEVPVAFSSFDGESSTGIGNIGVGINYYSGNFQGHLSIGIPTADDSEAAFIGILTDVTERLNTFNTNAVPVKLLGSVNNQPLEGFVYRVHGGFELAIASEDFVETELYFGLTALAGYAFPGGLIRAGLSTIALVTESELDFGERVIESLILNGEFTGGNVVPGVILRIPIDTDLSEVYNLVVGVSVAFMLN